MADSQIAGRRPLCFAADVSFLFLFTARCNYRA